MKRGTSRASLGELLVQVKFALIAPRWAAKAFPDGVQFLRRCDFLRNGRANNALFVFAK
jgi:hypothetical protein